MMVGPLSRLIYLSYHLDNNRCHLYVTKESIVVYI